jgi:K(+)-stimulated pyrophosphate-energized sodium pump
VGDPFKDTSGPSMNILIKLMSIVSLVIAPTLAKMHPTTSMEVKAQTVEIAVINTDSTAAMNDSTTTVTISADTKTLVQALQEDGLAPKDNVNIQIKDGKISVNGVALTETQNVKYASYLQKK